MLCHKQHLSAHRCALQGSGRWQGSVLCRQMRLQACHQQRAGIPISCGRGQQHAYQAFYLHDQLTAAQIQKHVSDRSPT